MSQANVVFVASDCRLRELGVYVVTCRRQIQFFAKIIRANSELFRIHSEGTVKGGFAVQFSLPNEARSPNFGVVLKKEKEMNKSPRREATGKPYRMRHGCCMTLGKSFPANSVLPILILFGFLSAHELLQVCFVCLCF